MRRGVALVETWLSQGRRAAIARPVGTVGLGPRSDEDLLLIDANGLAAGTLLAGTANGQAIDAARHLLAADAGLRHVLIGADIGFDDATAAGLTCGGHVDILVQRLEDIGSELWDAIAAGRPAALVTRLDAAGGTLVVRPGVASVGT